MPFEYGVQNSSAKRPESKFSVICLDRQGILSLGEEWERLSRNVVEENPYFSPTFMRAMLETVECNSDIKALAVYKDSTLLGFCPFVAETWRWLGAAAVNRAWMNPYTTLTIPLVGRQCPREIVQALVYAMGDYGTRGSFWLFDNFNLEGAVGELFDDVVKARNLPSIIFDEFDRPTLDQGSTFDQHMLCHVAKKRRSGLKRNRKRLNEIGRVEMRTFTSGTNLTSAVEDFLSIEASGWKGEKGTALACHENTKAFARQVFGDVNGKSITRADILYLDNQAIAVSLTICVGETAFTLKCTYDEAYRSFSPGLLLEQDIIKDFFETGWVERLDSAITTSSHVLQGLWNNTIRVGDLLLCADDSRSRESFQNYARLEKLRRLCRQKLKYIVAKSRGDAV